MAALAIYVGALGDGPRAQAQLPQNANFDLVTLAYGLDQPTAAAWLPDGRLLVTEKEGRLYLVDPDATRREILDLSDHVVDERERGLYDVAVDTDFAENGLVYLLYTYRVNPVEVTGPQAIRLTRVRLDGAGDVTGPEQVILGRQARSPCPLSSNTLDCIPSFDNTHQGGTVQSDPRDGTLWVSTGDSNEPTEPNDAVFRVWDIRSLSGKVLHVDRAGRGLRGHPFCPRLRKLSRVCTKIHARGFRNPFRLVLRGKRPPLLSDVGWAVREEIDILRRGRNYGWPCFEGSLHTPVYREMSRCRAAYARQRKLKRSAARARLFQEPLYQYGNRGDPSGKGLDQAAVIVGPQYRTGPYPDSFDGRVFFGDYAASFIKVLRLNRGGTGTRGITTLFQGVAPVDFSLTPRATISYVDFLSGEVRELVYSPENKSPRAQIDANPSSGALPLMVQFDGGGSTDPDSDSLTYLWDFGDATPTDTGQSVAHTYSTAGPFEAKLTVTDPGGLSSTRKVIIHPGNTAPTATIAAPTPDAKFTVGEPVSLMANGSDAEDGSLPDSAFEWSVTLVHRAHWHPLGAFSGPAASFSPVSDHDADSNYMITLSVTDSQGLTTTLPPREIQPRTVALSLRSSLRRLRIDYGERSYRTPADIITAIGYRPLVAAPLFVRRRKRIFRFLRWSDGRRRVHGFRVPDTPLTLVARYRRVAKPG